VAPQVAESQADGVRSIGGVAPTQSTAITATSAAMKLHTTPYILLRLKFVPGSIDDDVFLMLSEAQVKADQQVYKQADELEEARISTFARQKQKVPYLEKTLAEAMRGVVFDRDEVVGRERRFAARELLAKYRERVEKHAATLPDSYTIEFSNNAIDYKYDFELGGLYFNRNSWHPCDVGAIEGCLSNGSGSHFFIFGGNRSRNDQFKERQSEFEGDFILHPPLISVIDTEKMRVNASGIPNSLLRSYNTQDTHLLRLPRASLVSVDRRLEMLTLKMDAQTAEEISKMRREPGADNQRQIRTLLHFTIREILGHEKRPTLKVRLDLLEIFSSENKLLLSDKGSGFRLGTEVLAGERAKQQAVEKKLEAQYASYDIVGLKLGMSLAAADKIVREHMSPTSEYRYERTVDIPGIYPRERGASERSPFGRSVVYIRLESTPPAKFLARDPVGSKRRWQVELSGHDVSERRSYWKTVAAQEIITLSVEKGTDGEDEVWGIYRKVQLSNADPSAIGDSLRGKYGKPSSGQGNQWVWGNSKCPPANNRLQADTLIRLDDGSNTKAVYWGKRRAGVTLVGIDAKQAMRAVWQVSPSGSRTGMPAEAAYRHCGPSISAFWNARGLTISMADFKSYFARFEDLFVSDEEAVAVKL